MCTPISSISTPDVIDITHDICSTVNVDDHSSSSTPEMIPKRIQNLLIYVLNVLDQIAGLLMGRRGTTVFQKIF